MSSIAIQLYSRHLQLVSSLLGKKECYILKKISQIVLIKQNPSFALDEVYGAAETMPITENTAVGVGITNAYGRTKYMIEEILQDFYNSKTLGEAKTDWSIPRSAGSGMTAATDRTAASASPRLRSAACFPASGRSTSD